MHRKNNENSKNILKSNVLYSFLTLEKVSKKAGRLTLEHDQTNLNITVG